MYIELGGISEYIKETFAFNKNHHSLDAFNNQYLFGCFYLL